MNETRKPKGKDFSQNFLGENDSHLAFSKFARHCVRLLSKASSCGAVSPSARVSAIVWEMASKTGLSFRPFSVRRILTARVSLSIVSGCREAGVKRNDGTDDGHGDEEFV